MADLIVVCGPQAVGKMTVAEAGVQRIFPRKSIRTGREAQRGPDLHLRLRL